MPAIGAYRQFVLAGKGAPSPLNQVQYQMLLGDDAFVAEMRADLGHGIGPREIGPSHGLCPGRPEGSAPPTSAGPWRLPAEYRAPGFAESDALLDALWAHIERPDLRYQHRWRVGDLLLWDNRSAMHRGDPFDNATRRVMHRTQIKGKVAPRAWVAAA